MYRLCSSLILIAVVAGCQVAPTRDAAEVRRIIEGHNANLERWYAEGRIDLAARVFSEDAWQMPPDSPPVVGRQAFIDFWTQATRWGTWTFELELQDLAVSGPIAVERGRYVLTFEPGPDAPIPHTEDHGNYVVYWRLEPDGEWRIVWDAPVSERPPAGGVTVEDQTNAHHEINYIEIAVTDIDAAKRFYAAAFDWKFTDYAPVYAGIRKRDGGEAGGLRLSDAVTTGGPLVILYSNDLEATLARVRDAGGRITQQPFEFPGGRRFHFQDPSGNELAVWSDR